MIKSPPFKKIRDFAAWIEENNLADAVEVGPTSFPFIVIAAYEEGGLGGGNKLEYVYLADFNADPLEYALEKDWMLD